MGLVLYNLGLGLVEIIPRIVMSLISLLLFILSKARRL
jgi:hypothetical protein